MRADDRPRFAAAGDAELSLAAIDLETGAVASAAVRRGRAAAVSDSKWDGKSAATSGAEEAKSAASSASGAGRRRARVLMDRMLGRGEGVDPFGRKPQHQAARSDADRRRRGRPRDRPSSAQSRASAGDGKLAEAASGDELDAFDVLGAGSAPEGEELLLRVSDSFSARRRRQPAHLFARSERFAEPSGAVEVSQLAAALDLAVQLCAAPAGGAVLALQPSRADSVTRKSLRGQRYASFSRQQGRPSAHAQADAQRLEEYLAAQHGVGVDSSGANAGRRAPALALDADAIARAAAASTLGGYNARGSRGLFVDIARRANPRVDDEDALSEREVQRYLRRHHAREEGSRRLDRGVPDSAAGSVTLEALDALSCPAAGSGGPQLRLRPQRPTRIRARNVSLRDPTGAESGTAAGDDLMLLELSAEGVSVLRDGGMSLREFRDILMAPAAPATSVAATAAVDLGNAPVRDSGSSAGAAVNMQRMLGRDAAPSAGSAGPAADSAAAALSDAALAAEEAAIMRILERMGI
jgi:hypothetical protein